MDRKRGQEKCSTRWMGKFAITPPAARKWIRRPIRPVVSPSTTGLPPRGPPPFNSAADAIDQRKLERADHPAVFRSAREHAVRPSRPRPRAAPRPRLWSFKPQNAESANQAADDRAVAKRLAETPWSRRSISFQISLKNSFRTIFSMPCPGA